MRTIRSYIINVYSIVGIAASVVMLFMVTGFLFGIVTPHKLTWILASMAEGIRANSMNWWVIALIWWGLAAWSVMFLVRTRVHPPLLVREDENGAVEVSTDALCTMARAEIRTQGITGPARAEFTRKFGSPVLQVWCDLTSVDESEGPVALGDRLKMEIERRFRKDFNLEGIRVSVIHQPRSNGLGKSGVRAVG